MLNDSNQPEAELSWYDNWTCRRFMGLRRACSRLRRS